MSTTAVKFLAAAALLAFASNALAEMHYVDANSTNATPPYTNWATAATNIQDAVDAAVAGDELVVTNGSYYTGGRAGNRVAVDKPLSLLSVNGPTYTTIDGGGSGRCVYLTNAASLSGFTLTHGAASRGGGVYCQSMTAVISNCVIKDNRISGLNSVVIEGAGAYGGTLNNCTLTRNLASATLESNGSAFAEVDGAGAYGCTLNNCTLSNNSTSATNNDTSARNSYAYAIGGGAYACTLNSCTLSGNSVSGSGSSTHFSIAQGGGASFCALNDCKLGGNSASFGGGALGGTLSNCTLSGNSASGSGGGTYSSTLINCTLSGNSVSGVGDGGGAYGGTLNNCIVYFNTAPSGANYDSSSALSYSCTMPQPAGGAGNISNAPLFVDLASGNLRLQPNSPCINAGNNSYVTNATDLDGNPRISGGVVDIGAYEYQWPQLTIAPSGPTVLLRWPTNNAGYDYTGFTLQSTTNIVSPVVWSTNSPAPVVVGGQNLVTNPISGPRQFYRLSQ